MSQTLPRIAVTMGDPAGIGPEICLRLLANAEVAHECAPVVFGDASVLRRVAEKLALPFSAPVNSKSEWPSRSDDFEAPAVLDLGCGDGNAVVPGVVAANCGEAAFQYFPGGATFLSPGVTKSRPTPATGVSPLLGL